MSKKTADEKAQAEYSQFTEQHRLLKEGEGEKDIASLLQWNQEKNKTSPYYFPGYTQYVPWVVLKITQGLYYLVNP